MFGSGFLLKILDLNLSLFKVFLFVVAIYAEISTETVFYEHILPFIILMLHVYQKLDSNILDMITIYKF